MHACNHWFFSLYERQETLMHVLCLVAAQKQHFDLFAQYNGRRFRTNRQNDAQFVSMQFLDKVTGFEVGHRMITPLSDILRIEPAPI